MLRTWEPCRVYSACTRAESGDDIMRPCHMCMHRFNLFPVTARNMCASRMLLIAAYDRVLQGALLT